MINLSCLSLMSAAIFSGLVLGISTNAQAGAQADAHAIAEIRATAHEFIIKQIDAHMVERTTVELGNLDPRLRLAPCTMGLRAFAPMGTRAMGGSLVGVQCVGPTRWSVFLRVNVVVEAPVLVAYRGLARGGVITADDLRIEVRRIDSLRSGYVSDFAQAVGMVASRHIRAGAALTPRMLNAQRLVRRGERVIMLISSGAMTVRASGKSLSDGVMGQVIDLRNARTGKRVSGRVNGLGTVEVAL